ncbi:hypothetical protein KKG46_00315 [Patescibacteria group bacterium]|nr:hypothetical protein [Patescibacteria group bacterium]
MQKEILDGIIDNPDPKFVLILESLPQPKDADIEKVRQALPQMYDFFIRKKNAFKKRDLKEFEKILEQEVDFVRGLDEFAFNY